jgi:Uma2 family endonuclease
MSTLAVPSSTQRPDGDIDTVADLLHSLGDVPPDRVIWNPLPGTATEEDLLLLVERDNRLCELVDGTLVEKSMGRYESFLAGWLITYLNLFLETDPCGVVLGEAALLRISTGRVRAPDVSFFSFSRLGGKDLADERISSMPADLAVEVVSESNTPAEMQKKKREYFASGTRLVWIIYPKSQTVDVFEQPSDEPTRTLRHDDTIEAGLIIPGFTLELEKLFSKRTK